MKHVIFYFSGTGNCLQAAKIIQKQLGDAQIISMGGAVPESIGSEYASVGFIYPIYFQGAPAKVVDFIKALEIRDHQQTYFYTVATYGGMALNGCSQIARLLAAKGITLHFGETVLMPSNYVVLYDMEQAEKATQKRRKGEQQIDRIASDIAARKSRSAGTNHPLLSYYYERQIKKTGAMDRLYQVSKSCTSCGVCQKVCPVGNISLSAGKPVFAHHCEQCMACIQYCPTKAINYKNKTQKRRRYHHPEISIKELSSYYQN